MQYQKDDRVEVYLANNNTHALGVILGYANEQLYVRLDDGRLASYPKAEPYMVNVLSVTLSFEPYPLFPGGESAWRERKILARIRSGERQ